ncbi:phosphoglycerate kinase [Patescibacteria group bacterium]|nr:phosphoglycerate kinase [Patescibacteria group bacterium]
MKSIKEVKDLKGKKVLLRLDLNVPVRDGKILNDFRIKKVIPTIGFLQERGAKVIILSHIGRKKEDTLKPVFDYLVGEVKNIKFNGDVLDESAFELVGKMKEGEVILMENLRKHEEEKEGDDSFSKQISKLGDIYVNESFSNSHRDHSSITGIPKFLPSYSGILFQKEIDGLSSCFEPQEPSLFILGGNKLKTKLSFVEHSLEIGSFVFVGGALANDFFKEKKFEIGKSFVCEEKFNLGSLLENKKLILPIDVVVRNSGGEIITKKPENVLSDEKILDAGPQTISLLEDKLKEVKFVLMNGPLGDYEKGFGKPTNDLIQAIAGSGIQSIIGGGDTTALINELGIEGKFTFVSTGGGAMLEFLQNKTLPGIEALG